MKNFLFTSLGALASTVCLSVAAAPMTFTGSGTAGTGPGQVPVSASSIFEINGNDLTITLKNTAPANTGKDVAGSTLTGLFWNFTSNPLLTPISASLAPGSSMAGDVCDKVSCVNLTNMGGEFGYRAIGLPGGADRGISTANHFATGLPGGIGNFNYGLAGTNLDGSRSISSINFGLISAASGFNPNNGLAAVPLIQDAVVFYLTGVEGLTYDDISNVSFQYGTTLSGLNVAGNLALAASVPEPSTLALLGLSLFGFSVIRRKS